MGSKLVLFLFIFEKTLDIGEMNIHSFFECLMCVLYHIFFWKSRSLLPTVGTLSTIPVKKYGLWLQDARISSIKKYLRSLCGSSELIGSVTGETWFSTADHLLTPREERHDEQKIRDDANDTKLKVLVNYLEVPDRRLILRAKNIYSLLTVWGTTINGAILVPMGFCGFCVRAILLPPHPPP